MAGVCVRQSACVTTIIPPVLLFSCFALEAFSSLYPQVKKNGALKKNKECFLEEEEEEEEGEECEKYERVRSIERERVFDLSPGGSWSWHVAKKPCGTDAHTDAHTHGHTSASAHTHTHRYTHAQIGTHTHARGLAGLLQGFVDYFCWEDQRRQHPPAIYHLSCLSINPLVYQVDIDGWCSGGTFLTKILQRSFKAP